MVMFNSAKKTRDKSNRKPAKMVRYKREPKRNKVPGSHSRYLPLQIAWIWTGRVTERPKFMQFDKSEQRGPEWSVFGFVCGAQISTRRDVVIEPLMGPICAPCTLANTRFANAQIVEPNSCFRQILAVNQAAVFISESDRIHRTN